MSIRRTVTSAILTAAAGVALTAAAPRAGVAQQSFVPTQAEASDPRAKLAAEFVQTLVSGDRAAAESYLKAHGAPDYVAGAMKEELDRFVAKAAPKSFKITGYMNGPGRDIIVEYEADGTQAAMGVVLQGEAADRIAGIRMLRQQ